MQLQPYPSPAPPTAPDLPPRMPGRADGSIQVLNMVTGARIRTCADETGLHTMRLAGKSTLVTLSQGLVLELFSYPTLVLVSSTPLATAMTAGENLPPAAAITMVVSGGMVVVGGLRPGEVSLLPLQHTAEGSPLWRRVELTGLSRACTVALHGGDPDVFLYSVCHPGEDDPGSSASGSRLHWAHRETGWGGCIASLSLAPDTIVEADGGFTLVSTGHGAVVTSIGPRGMLPKRGPKPKAVAKAESPQEDEAAEAPAKGDGKCRKGDRKKRRDGERDLNKEKKGKGRKRGGETGEV
jgi:hypothetical protein